VNCFSQQCNNFGSSIVNTGNTYVYFDLIMVLNNVGHIEQYSVISLNKNPVTSGYIHFKFNRQQPG